MRPPSLPSNPPSIELLIMGYEALRFPEHQQEYSPNPTPCGLDNHAPSEANHTKDTVSYDLLH